MPRLLSPVVRENITQTIRHTIDILLAASNDVELYNMLAGLSTLTYGVLSKGPVPDGSTPPPEQPSSQVPSPGHYL